MSSKLYRLEDLLEITSSKRIHMADYVSSGVPFYRGKEVIERSKGNAISTELFITSEQYQSIKRKFGSPQDGDILLTSVGTLGIPYYISGDGDFYFKDGNVTWFRNFSSKINSKFLLYWLSSSAVQQRLDEVSIGSTQRALTISALKSLEIELPDVPTQKMIVGVLDAVTDRITLLRETNATLEAIAQALFKSWFVDFDPVRAKAEGLEPEGMDAATAALFPDSFEESELGLVPLGWTIARLGDVTERITKGTTPTTLKRAFVESGINFVKVESLTDDGQFLLDKFAYINDETHQLLSRSQLKGGDVLITIAGTIGRVAVMTDDFIPANTNQAVALVRPKPNGLPSAFISRFLRLSGSKAQMGERVVQAVQANLSLGSLSDMRLVMPPADVAIKLHETAFGVIESNKHSNQRRMRTLAQLLDALLPRLISGQLRLPEAEAQIEVACA